MKKTIAFVFNIFVSQSLLYASNGNYVEHWLSGVQHAQKHELVKSIDEYSQAINLLNSDKIFENLNLYLERGNVYLENLEYDNAIRDFTFVINSQNVSENYKADALIGRSKAYLLRGKLADFENDVSIAGKIEPMFAVSAKDYEDYIVFQMSPRLRRTKSMEKVLIQMLKINNYIDSENDVAFSSSGIAIIKKSKSQNFSSKILFE
jgi:tetratricopeptide (TPR) repeat protein